MKFSVLLFAVLKDRAGCEQIEIEMPPSNALPTVALLLHCASEQFSALAPWLPHVRVAVNCEYAANDRTIAPDDEIAFLPPVSGGTFD